MGDGEPGHEAADVGVPVNRALSGAFRAVEGPLTRWHFFSQLFGGARSSPHIIITSPAGFSVPPSTREIPIDCPNTQPLGTSCKTMSDKDAGTPRVYLARHGTFAFPTVHQPRQSLSNRTLFGMLVANVTKTSTTTNPRGAT